MTNTDTVTNLVRGLIDDKLKSDGRNVYEYEDDNKFTLSQPFVSSSSIQVFQGDTLLTPITDWTYSSTTNQVTITASLTSLDIITITYSYYAKYSDTEILGYIESALCYFVEYRYKKVFEMDTNDEIITYDGVNPTKAEIQLIALITAIMINPDNVDIKTKEFSVSSTEEKSKSQQISIVFSKFLRNFGNIEFIEDEE